MKFYLIKLIAPVLLILFGFSTWNNIAIFENLGYSYLPLSFGLVIGLINFKIDRFRSKLLQLFGVLTISFILFYLNLLLSLYLPKLINLNEANTIILFKIVVFIISPLIVLFSYYWFYRIKLTLGNIMLSVLAAGTTYLYAQFQFLSYSTNTDQLFNPYLVWQVVVVLILQFMIYKKELFSLFEDARSKN